MPNVFTAGNFDLLHAGHVDLLAQCRELAGENGRVIVGLATDRRVAALRKGRPIVDYSHRRRLLDALRDVDDVQPFTSDLDLAALLARLCPDLLVYGAEWSGREVIGGKFFPVYFAQRKLPISSTRLIETILERATVGSWAAGE